MIISNLFLLIAVLLVHKSHCLAASVCRRGFLNVGSSTLVVGFTSSVLAEAEENILEKKKVAPKKPFAPPEALLPAARVKYTIDEALILVVQYETKKEEEQEIIIKSLKKLLGVTTFMSPLSGSGEVATPIDETIMNPSNAKVYQQTYNEKLRELGAVNVPYALLVQAGDYRQFNILQQRQRKLEQQNLIRQAFNYYTRQLQFDTEYYILNASPQLKKKMIRNDALPDIKAVIVSDLDLRDLTRNQVLDAYDDVKFELEYQVKQQQQNENFDSTELKTALLRAKKECDEWFGFIADEDVEVAMITVKSEL
mmetsp:Transcript_179/g.215  ORF Transcript_179/g.215 Transcript_179/m.215 type:complete len:310 (+) Transcript_179:118-1047(+)